ncbi:MAG TPA: histidinol-phosphate transaminase [Spirochaetota bacterium]|nr:histidinol-phosphate transaminase [Spirochaetota bacterium]HQO39664.1 histidinol-phosphate transaminase [Spirochaetota bacterium]
MKFWNSTLKGMEEYIPGEQPANIDEYIKLNTNENPFPPSEKVLGTIREAVNAGLRRYPDSLCIRLRQVFAEQNNLSPENVFAGNGSDEIFTLIFRGLIEKDGTAAFPYPSYSLYDTLAQSNAIKYEKIKMESGFNLNLERFLDKKYDMVIIANPNNPTGTFIESGMIRSFLDRFKGLLVVDEAYIDFYGGSAIELTGEYDNLLVTRSFSKSCSLAGLRVGLAVAHRDIIRGLVKIKDSYNVDSLAQAGAAAALLDRKTFEYNINMLRSNKEYLEERLDDLGFERVPSRANFLLARHPQISSEELYLKLKEERILVRHFKEPVISDYVRISVGTMMEIKKLCALISSILEGV